MRSEEACTHCMRRAQDPSGWIVYQKRRWRAAAAARKKRRLEAAKQAARPAAAPAAANIGAAPKHSHAQLSQACIGQLGLLMQDPLCQGCPAAVVITGSFTITGNCIIELEVAY